MGDDNHDVFCRDRQVKRVRSTSETFLGRVALLLCQVAGLLELVILPLWVGGLIQHYKFSPQLAVALVGAFMAGSLIANAILSRRFGGVSERAVATVAFATEGIAIVLMTAVTKFPAVSPFAVFAVLNVIAGCGAGAGLAMVHGVLGRSANPHRLYGIVNVGVSLFGIVFFALTPALMRSMSVNAVFFVAAAEILLATAAAALFFPAASTDRPMDMSAGRDADGARHKRRILGTCFLGVAMLQAASAATLGFVERIGDFRGFHANALAGMFVVAGTIPAVAPIVATRMQNRIKPLSVAVCGLAVQALLSMIIFRSVVFAPYAVAYSMFVATVLFVQTFVFGFLAMIDPSSRTNAAMMSMLMTGELTGIVISGVVATHLGYPAVGFAAAACSILGVLFFVITSLLLASETRGADLRVRHARRWDDPQASAAVGNQPL